MIKNNLLRFISERGIKIPKLATLSGVGQRTLSKLCHNKTKSISCKTMNELCSALDCSVEDLFEYIPD